MSEPKREIAEARIDALLSAIRELLKEPGCGDPDCCESAIRAEAARARARLLLKEGK